MWRSSGDMHGAYKQCKKHISLWNLLLAKRWNVINTPSACRFIILLKQQNRKFWMHWMKTWESDAEARADNGTRDIGRFARSGQEDPDGGCQCASTLPLILGNDSMLHYWLVLNLYITERSSCDWTHILHTDGGTNFYILLGCHRLQLLMKND